MSDLTTRACLVSAAAIPYVSMRQHSRAKRAKHLQLQIAMPHAPAALSRILAQHRDSGALAFTGQPDGGQGADGCRDSRGGSVGCPTSAGSHHAAVSRPCRPLHTSVPQCRPTTVHAHLLNHPNINKPRLVHAFWLHGRWLAYAEPLVLQSVNQYTYEWQHGGVVPLLLPHNDGVFEGSKRCRAYDSLADSGRVFACRLKTAERAQLRTALVAVVANALYYNAVLALGHLQQQVISFFQVWSEVCPSSSPCPALPCPCPESCSSLSLHCPAVMLHIPGAALLPFCATQS